MSELQPKDVVQKYLSEKKILQLATSQNGQPWLCNLHFTNDEEGAVYWISKQDRRHSLELAKNPKAAITIAVQTESPLIGIQAEGTATIVQDEQERRKVMNDYVERHHTDQAFAKRVAEGIDAHTVYKFTPVRFTLFDQEHFASQPLQEWVIK